MRGIKECKLVLLISLFIVAINGSPGSPRVDPLVETDAGLIKGLGATDGDYAMFMGIPYATIDADNPFAPSFPYPKQERVLEAYDDSVVCPQYDTRSDEIVGVVDCLRLNVYVPNSASSRNQVPVLVWIYGGSYEHGHGSRSLYDPKYLVKHDVIVVTFNYRTGPYGFMCLDIPEVPGNAGLKDQRLALRWVKENIAKFGGDPNSITIAGQSAGATSVDYHLHYSANENLFHKAIMQSGSTQGYLSRNDPDRKSPLILAEHLGFVTDDLKAAISFLASSDPKLVVAAFLETRPKMKPCAEIEFENTERFVSDYGLNVKVPKVKNIPVLVGFTDDERLNNYGSISAESFEKLNVLEDLLKEYFIFAEEEFASMKNKVAHFYWSDESMSENIKQHISDFDGDITFVYPITRNIQKYLDNNAKAIYQYLFSYVGSRNYNTSFDGAVHSDDIVYLWDSSYLPQPNSDDQILIDRMTTMWTNFAKYGDPTPATSDLLPVKWEPVTKDKFNYLNIDLQLSVRQRPFHNRMAFWDTFFELNEKKQKYYDESKP